MTWESLGYFVNSVIMLYKQQKDSSHTTYSPFVEMSPPQRALVIAFSWALLLVITVFAMINGTVGAPLVVALLLISVLVHLFPLVHYRKEYGWFHPLIFTSIFYFYGLLGSWKTYAFGLQNRGLIGYDAQAQSHILAYSLVLIILAQIAYYTGYFAGPKLPVSHVIQFSRPVGLQIKAILISLFVLILFGFYIMQQGGVNAHFLFLAQGRSNLVRQGLFSGEWVVIVRFSFLACLLWLLYDRDAASRPWFWLIFGSSLFAQYLVAGSRSNFINAILITLIASTILEQRIRVVRTIVLILASIAFIGAAAELRTGTWRQEVSWQVLLNPDIEQSFITGLEELTFRSSEIRALYPIIAKVPEEVDLLYGQAYINFLTTPIPRAIWRAKPQGFGNQTGLLFFGLSAPIPPGAIGEAYWNFHIPGVLVIFFLYGVFHEWLARLFLLYGREPAVIIMYSYIIFRFVPEVYAATLLLQFIFSLLLLLLLLGVIRFSRRSGVEQTRGYRPILDIRSHLKK